jgi:hypothetical protein
MIDDWVDWPTCNVNGCRGVIHADTPTCLAHTNAPELGHLVGYGSTLDLRGVSISPELLAALIAAAPIDTSEPDGDHRVEVKRPPVQQQPCAAERLQTPINDQPGRGTNPRRENTTASRFDASTVDPLGSVHAGRAELANGCQSSAIP